MKQTPTVSIIVPNYNHAKFLQKRIDSILNQTYTDFELILLDDASTDDSRGILESYRDKSKVSAIVCNEQNSGSTFLQWDKGFKLAQGEYIWLAESDDYADASFLETVMSVLLQVKNAVLAFTGSYMVDEDDNTLPINWDKWTESGKNKVYEGEKYAKRRLSFNNSIYNASMVVFKKKVLERIDKSFLTYKCSGDWQFWAEVAPLGNVVEIRRKLNYFRQHTNKVSYRYSQTELGYEEDMRASEYVLSHVPTSKYRRQLIRGIVYKKIKHSNFSEETKKRLLLEGQKRLHVTRKSYYMERANKILVHIIPLLLNPK